MPVRTYGSVALDARQARREAEDEARIATIKTLLADLPPLSRPRYASDDRWTEARRSIRWARWFQRRRLAIPMAPIAP